MWVAQPEHTRHGPPEFEHHGSVPLVELGNCRATVFIGAFAGAVSPARADTDHFGADLVVRSGTSTLPLRKDHEHAIVALSGNITIDGTKIDGTALDADVLAYLGEGRDELELSASDDARLILLGGSPFETRPLMWWNYVAREHDEINAAYRDWQSGDARFGPVASSLEPVPAPTPPWLREGTPFAARRA
jgi:redox-sensitive bicupin YhaK (pirin superfamily)